MPAIPPVLAATAPAPESFRSLRRSIRAMNFLPNIAKHLLRTPFLKSNGAMAQGLQPESATTRSA
jgi:hypothetical protein